MVSGDSFQLISTLIAVPPADTRLIERDRLLQRLDRAAGHQLIHVRAPAGFGKTSLVASWVQRRRARGARVAWLSLNDSHDDVRVLLRYLVAALRTTWGTLGEATLTLLNSNLPISDSALVTTLVNEIGGIADDTTVVLDDFHCLTSAAANNAFHAFVTHAPTRLHLVTTSREALAFPVGRLRQLGQLYEIDAGDLEFSSSEVERFLLREQLALSPPESAALARNTGGWAAGLRLAAICMRDEPARAGFIDSFSGGHVAIAEFLQEDVLNRQPEALQLFLLDSGVLDELSAPLCDHVLECNDSAAMLERIHDKGLFLFSLDGQRERFRYHRLFADFLRHRLCRLQPERARQLQLRASAWHAARGDAYPAVEYALRAGDALAAGRLLENVSETIFSGGQLELLLNLARRLPQDVLRTCPRLQLDLIWIHTLKWEITQAVRMMADVQAYLRGLADAGEVPAMLREKVLHREIMIALMQDSLAEAETLWAQWPEVATGREAYFEGSAETAHLLAARERHESRYVLGEAPRVRGKFVEAGAEFGTVWFDSIVGPACLMAGDAAKAETTLRGAIDVAIRISGTASPLVAMPSLLLGEVLYERNELDAVADLVQRWLPLADHIGFVDQLIAGYLCAARLAFIGHDDVRAQALLDRGDELAAKHAFPRMGVHLAGERVRQLLAHGQRREAGEWAARQPAMAVAPLPPRKQSTVADEVVLLTNARLSRGTATAACHVPALEAWIRHTEKRGCTRSAIRLRALLASVWHAAGDDRAAWRVLRPALGLGATSGLLRPLLDEGPGMRSLLEAASASSATTEPALRAFSAELCGVLAAESDRPASASPAHRPLLGAVPPVDSLTPREREILCQIADGASNKEIAARLGVSEATVKWHLQHTFHKLGVHRRTSASRRAHELGLI